MKKYLAIIFTLSFSLSVYSQSIERTISIPRPAENGSRYFYVPFDVPAGTKSISISYEYDQKAGSNALDLGVFDPNFDESEKSISGFRGWSGGRRNTIYISEQSATNGYLPGPIPGGTWRVILGLYKVEPAGVNVNVKVKLNEMDAKAEAERRSENEKVFNFEQHRRTKPTKADGFTWYRGDLHVHTFHSDGHWTLKGILDYAEANDLDFLGFTDHNTTSHHTELDSLAKNYGNLLVMRGEEVTTYGGHFNVWGLPSGNLVDFRVTPGDRDGLFRIVSAVHNDKLLASINHPAALCEGCGWSYGEDWSPMDSVEVWNGEWDATDEAALKKWDASLQKGSRITAIGSSDSHVPPSDKRESSNSTVSLPTTFVGASAMTQERLLGGIKEHRVFVAAKPSYFISFSTKHAGIGEEATLKNGETTDFTIRTDNFPVGSNMTVILNGKIVNHVTISAPNSFSHTFRPIFNTNSYVRIEIRQPDNRMLAFTNPIFIKI